jgi:hypothetical protein
MTAPSLLRAAARVLETRIPQRGHRLRHLADQLRREAHLIEKETT